MNLQALVSQTYPSPEWAVFFEVANGTGFKVKRHADAVALGIWPSRGQALIGFEFKEFRNDWLREKKNPQKAEEIASHCDSWFVVAGSEGVVKLDELPEPWGLYQANKDRTKLKLLKPCVPFPDRDKLIMRRQFVAAMLRKVSETTVPAAVVQTRIEEAVALALERTTTGNQIKQLELRCDKQTKIISRFKELTGVDLDGWEGPQMLAAVRAVMQGDSHRRSLEYMAQKLGETSQEVAKALAAWPNFELRELTDETP